MVNEIEWTIRREDALYGGPEYFYHITARLGRVYIQQLIDNYLIHRYWGKDYVFWVAVLIQKRLLKKVFQSGGRR